MIVIAKQFTSYRTSQVAIVSGARRDNSPTVRFNVADRREGEIFRVPPEAARDLLAEGSVVEARLTGKLAALSDAVLDVQSPLAAALAGLAVPGVRTWHGTVDERSNWQPSAAALGPTRSGFDAHFASEAEVVDYWAAGEASTPLFSFLVEGADFRRAFVWRSGALLEIPTQIVRF
jgi:hypothetical protein